MSLKNTVLFIPHNAYHTYNMYLIMKELKSLDVQCSMLNIDKVHNEGVTKQAKKLGINTIDYSPLFLLKSRPCAIVTMNDWGRVTKKNVLLANLLGIPTFSIIEGVQDFEDTHIQTHPHFKKRYPYLRSKFALLTGKYDKKYIKSQNAHIVGIARIEELVGKDVLFPKKPKILINANFSYGKYAKSATKWLNDAVEACKEARVDYCISQHIADKTDISCFNVCKNHINQELCESTLLISRFSTSILECMALGKPVIYFNNFNEKVDKFLDSNGAFESPTSKDELKIAIKKTIEQRDQYIEKSKDFLKEHVSIHPQKSSARRAAEFIFINRQISKPSLKEKFHIITKELQRRYIHTH